ncbi:hypothetical protein IEQ34_019364 [Dendrobium chrysotoxum]|uniref:Uncharacterized protein n=1 Tax=Dendrobium chrysotoxum TaxID=161865 RepID=A0AAV7G7K5_DENCH|nr:hypothetical protein IEQ34_019364 [Dendrobium chrysotoxum]
MANDRWQWLAMGGYGGGCRWSTAGGGSGCGWWLVAVAVAIVVASSWWRQWVMVKLESTLFSVCHTRYRENIINGQPKLFECPSFVRCTLQQSKLNSIRLLCALHLAIAGSWQRATEGQILEEEEVNDLWDRKYKDLDIPEALLDLQDNARVEKMIRYIEDADLRRWELVGIKEFQIGIREARAKLNALTNPQIFEQLLELDADDLISKGNSYVASRLDAANKLLAKPFKIRLGRGLYGECLAIRADGNAEFSHEIALELSSRSAAAVIFMQRGNLKMCLRTTDCATDTSEIAKAFGGGGKPCSSSFIIRMDEYNEWTTINSPFSRNTLLLGNNFMFEPNIIQFVYIILVEIDNRMHSSKYSFIH